MSLSGAIDPHHETNGAGRWWSVREIVEDLCIRLKTVRKWSPQGEPPAATRVESDAFEPEVDSAHLVTGSGGALIGEFDRPDRLEGVAVIQLTAGRPRDRVRSPSSWRAA